MSVGKKYRGTIKKALLAYVEDRFEPNDSDFAVVALLPIGNSDIASFGPVLFYSPQTAKGNITCRKKNITTKQ